MGARFSPYDSSGQYQWYESSTAQPIKRVKRSPYNWHYLASRKEYLYEGVSEITHFYRREDGKRIIRIEDYHEDTD